MQTMGEKESEWWNVEKGRTRKQAAEGVTGREKKAEAGEKQKAV